MSPRLLVHLGALATVASGWHTGAPPLVSQLVVRRTSETVRMEQTVFKTPKSTDTAAEEQALKTAEQGLGPREWADKCRAEAKEHLSSVGAHIAAPDADAPPQLAEFTKLLWGVDSIPSVPAEAASDPTRVLATVYEIGGPLTSVLSTSVAKQLPLIPHVGIRLHGVEYFYSDHIEMRTVPVMEEMLADRPQITLDLGASKVSPDELEAIITSLEADWTADDYHVFDKNCVHFASALGERVAASGVGMPPVLIRGVLDVSERMLDSLPEWRRKLGRRVMNEVTRLVVVSWGKASKEKKEATADKLGLERGD